MHRVVQYLPMMPRDSMALAVALDHLVTAHFLTEAERAAVDILMLERLYQSDFVKDMAARAVKIEQEVSFVMQVEPWIVSGQIDLFFETAEGYEIVDFKTDRTADASRYQKQLEMYAEALSIARGKPVTHKWLYWLRHNKVEEV